MGVSGKTSRGQCRQLTEAWPAGYHAVSGRRYWLDQVFTLDDDNNGGVDNIGFLLTNEDRADLYIYYFPSPGRKSVVSAPTLRLADDRDVPGVCAGRQKYKKPEHASEQGKDGSHKPESVAGAHSAAKSFWDGPGLIFSILGGVGLMVFLGGIIGYALAKRRSDRRREEQRQRKQRRSQARRQQEQATDGEEQRATEDRRDEDERRGEDERRE